MGPNSWVINQIHLWFWRNIFLTNNLQIHCMCAFYDHCFKTMQMRKYCLQQSYTHIFTQTGVCRQLKGSVLLGREHSSFSIWQILPKNKVMTGRIRSCIDRAELEHPHSSLCFWKAAGGSDSCTVTTTKSPDSAAVFTRTTQIFMGLHVVFIYSTAIAKTVQTHQTGRFRQSDWHEKNVAKPELHSSQF